MWNAWRPVNGTARRERPPHGRAKAACAPAAARRRGRPGVGNRSGANHRMTGWAGELRNVVENRGGHPRPVAMFDDLYDLVSDVIGGGPDHVPAATDPPGAAGADPGAAPRSWRPHTVNPRDVRTRESGRRCGRFDSRADSPVRDSPLRRITVIPVRIAGNGERRISVRKAGEPGPVRRGGVPPPAPASPTSAFLSVRRTRLHMCPRPKRLPPATASCCSTGTPWPTERSTR